MNTHFPHLFLSISNKNETVIDLVLPYAEPIPFTKIVSNAQVHFIYFVLRSFQDAPLVIELKS